MSQETGNESLAELAQRAEMVRDRVRHVASEIRALLGEDLPKFVERQMKRGFVEHPGFASQLSEARLRELKTAVRVEGDAGRDQVLGALEDSTLWFPSHGPEGRATIADNPALWTAVSRITDTVNGLRQRFGYPPPSEPVEYKPPTWFIGRRYLPTLSENYWRLLSELRDLETRAASIERDSSRTELAKRWDAIDD